LKKSNFNVDLKSALTIEHVGKRHCKWCKDVKNIYFFVFVVFCYFLFFFCCWKFIKSWVKNRLATMRVYGRIKREVTKWWSDVVRCWNFVCIIDVWVMVIINWNEIKNLDDVALGNLRKLGKHGERNVNI
jgi:hypothetical protein